MNKEDQIIDLVKQVIKLKAELKDNQNLIVNVGAAVTVEKSSSEVVEILEQQKKDLTENILEAEKIFNQLQEQAMNIYKEVEAGQ